MIRKRKIFAVLIVVLVVGSMCGCIGSDKNDDDRPNPTQAPEPTVKPTIKPTPIPTIKPTPKWRTFLCDNGKDCGLLEIYIYSNKHIVSTIVITNNPPDNRRTKLRPIVQNVREEWEPAFLKTGSYVIIITAEDMDTDEIWEKNFAIEITQDEPATVYAKFVTNIH